MKDLRHYFGGAPTLLSKEASSDTYVEHELYDLYADPYELSNLIGMESHQALCKVLAARLLQQMEKMGEPLPEIIPAESRPSGQRRVNERDFWA